MLALGDQQRRGQGARGRDGDEQPDERQPLGAQREAEHADDSPRHHPRDEGTAL